MYSRQSRLIPRHWTAGLILLVLAALPLSAADRLTISLGDLGGADWHASGIELQLDLGAESDQYRIRADEVRHPALPDVLKSFVYHCRSGSVTADVIACREGIATFQLGNFKQRDLGVRINWNIAHQSIDLKVKNIKIAGGVLAADLALQEERWQLSVSGSNLNLSRLDEFAPPFADLANRFGVAGRADLKGSLRGRGKQVASVDSTLDFREVQFSGPAGEYLGQGLSGQLQVNGVAGRGGWNGQQRLSIESGEMLTPYFYLSAAESPLKLATGFDYTLQPGRLRLNSLRLDHGEHISIRGEGEWMLDDGWRLSRIRLGSPPSSLSRLFNAYLVPVLTQPMMQQIDLQGRIGFDLEYGNDNSHLDLTLLEAAVEQNSENGQPFRLEGVTAELHWASQAPAPESRISWRSGQLFQEITLGPATLGLQIAGKRLSLLEPASIGVLDGSLHAEQFELEQGDKGPRVTFQGYLTPISMQAISRALEWPPLSGQLSGMIPAVSYENGVIAVDGVALVKLFEGDILIRNLRLDDLFGVLPALDADLEFKNIDLETLTSTFSFGKITGKLAGRVEGLRMEDWMPVSFDARFATPEGDETRHRISQKAVDNISNLGGSGVSGAISRSFLRFFEEFGYDRLGISCRLRQGVCEMDGIEPAERGYYLVKGGGIPRIDIIGFNRRTDWAILVSKLKQVTEGGPPVIE